MILGCKVRAGVNQLEWTKLAISVGHSSIIMCRQMGQAVCWLINILDFFTTITADLISYHLFISDRASTKSQAVRICKRRIFSIERLCKHTRMFDPWIHNTVVAMAQIFALLAYFFSAISSTKWRINCHYLPTNIRKSTMHTSCFPDTHLLITTDSSSFSTLSRSSDIKHQQAIHWCTGWLFLNTNLFHQNKAPDN